MSVDASDPLKECPVITLQQMCVCVYLVLHTGKELSRCPLSIFITYNLTLKFWMLLVHDFLLCITGINCIVWKTMFLFIFKHLCLCMCLNSSFRVSGTIFFLFIMFYF